MLTAGMPLEGRTGEKQGMVGSAIALNPADPNPADNSCRKQSGVLRLPRTRIVN